MRVYFEDTDAGGVVYHSRYLNFFERARTELLSCPRRESMTDLRDRSTDLIWVVLDINVRFQAGRETGRRTVGDGRSWTWIKGVRQGFSQQMTRKSDGVLVATAELTAVLLKADSLKPAS